MTTPGAREAASKGAEAEVGSGGGLGPPSGAEPSSVSGGGESPVEVYRRLLDRNFPWVADSTVLAESASEWDETDQIPVPVEVPYNPPPAAERFITRQRQDADGDFFTVEVENDGYLEAAREVQAYEEKYRASVRKAATTAEERRFDIPWKLLEEQSSRLVQRLSESAVLPPRES